MSNMIETHALRKHYGKFEAVRGLDLAVPSGAIYGFVGPNGAGKTTTMHLLTALAKPTSGTVRVAGFDVRKERANASRAIGYMPDEFGVYEDLRVWEYLDFFAMCYDIPAHRRKVLIGELLELVELKHRREDNVDQLSKGMKQRLSLARTLVHDPQVLILDEPASGLDPRARVEIRELLAELARMGKTIFFSTHILADVEDICSHVGIIEAGEMVVQGSLRELKARFMETREVIVTLLHSEDSERVRQAALGVAGVKTAQVIAPKHERARLRVDCVGDDAVLSALHRALASFDLLGFHEDEKTLESMFMRLTKGLVT